MFVQSHNAAVAHHRGNPRPWDTEGSLNAGPELSVIPYHQAEKESHFYLSPTLSFLSIKWSESKKEKYKPIPVLSAAAYYENFPLRVKHKKGMGHTAAQFFQFVLYSLA